MNVVRFFYLLCVCSVLLCCKSASRKQSSGDPKTSEGIDTVSRISIKYAKGFWLEERDGCVVLNIKDPQESSHTHYQYALIPRGVNIQPPENMPVVQLPVRIDGADPKRFTGGGVARAECHLHDFIAVV